MVGAIADHQTGFDMGSELTSAQKDSIYTERGRLRRFRVRCGYTVHLLKVPLNM